MVILIAGDTHTGKTLLAQRLSERCKCPYLSIDHLKMGLIRSGLCRLSAESSDDELTDFLWPVVREIVKTCIENSQNMIVEGCYIPFGWEKDFTDEYVGRIKYVCLIFSQEYIRRNFRDILKYENVVEKRRPSEITPESLSITNKRNLEQCISHKYCYILIDGEYKVDADEACGLLKGPFCG